MLSCQSPVVLPLVKMGDMQWSSVYQDLSLLASLQEDPKRPIQLW